jgi:hypothetical protein
MNRDQLIEEIVENARRDRKRLETTLQGLTTGFKSFNENPEEEEQLNTAVAAAYAEIIAKVGEVLTRVNHELVELVKADKSITPTGPGKLNAADVRDVYEEISPEEQPN